MFTSISSWFSGTRAPPSISEASARAEESAHDEHDRLAYSVAAAAMVRDSIPRNVAVLIRNLDRRGERLVGRLVYSAKLRIRPADLRAGSVEPQQQVPCHFIGGDVDLKGCMDRGVRAIAIAMHVVESDSRQMPFSIVWRATGDDKDAFVAAAETHWRATQDRGRSERAIPAHPILSRPKAVEEYSINTAFEAFEAYGFDAKILMQNVAQLTRSGCYRIPISYTYSGLLRNVHSACMLAEHRARLTPLEVQTMPINDYQVLSDGVDFLMHGSDLERAIAYIEKVLKPRNFLFELMSPVLLAEPFGGGKWTEAWQAAMLHTSNAASVAGAITSPAAHPIAIEASLTMVVYVGLIPPDGCENGFAMPVIPHAVAGDAAHGSSTPKPASRTHEVRSYAQNGGEMTMEIAGASHSEDEDDDEDGSVDVATLRSAHAQAEQSTQQPPAQSASATTATATAEQKVNE